MMQRKPLSDAKYAWQNINRLWWLTLDSMCVCNKETQTMWAACCACLMEEWRAILKLARLIF
jgi:hypothetical protein